MPSHPTAPSPLSRTSACPALSTTTQLPPVWSQLNPVSRQQVAQQLAILIRRRLDHHPTAVRSDVNDRG